MPDHSRVESRAARGEIDRLQQRSAARVATQLADYLFVIIAVAIAVSQAFILRSTARGMRADTAVRSVTLEWAYAILPAIALVFLLLFAWGAMHPVTLDVQGVAPPTGIRS
jgi:hypothetical protein